MTETEGGGARAGGALEAELRRRMSLLRGLFDLDELKGQGSSGTSIRKYYEESRLGYYLVHSKDGAMHMALNPDGAFDKEGYGGQAQLVAARLSPAATDVLELASGNGYNLSILAQDRRDVSFVGVDLVPEQVQRAERALRDLPNARAVQGDFHDLDFPDQSFDLVFVVESFCHAIDLERAFREVQRVLRPGGTFIVIDAWRADGFGDLGGDVKEAAASVESAMAVAEGRQLSAWKAIAGATGFSEVEDVDLTREIKPNLERLARVAENRFVTHPVRARFLKAVLPSTLTTNAVSGYLMPLTVELGAHTYRMIVLSRA